LPFRVRIVGRLRELWSRDLNQPLKLVAQFLRSSRRDIILRARRQCRSERRQVGKLRRVIVFPRESFAHRLTLILTFSLREKELSLPLGETDAQRQ
jgi:hypothetical protein